MSTLFPQFRQHGCRITSLVSRGHDVVVLENRTIRLAVARTKGADVVELRYKPLDVDCLARTSTDLVAPGLRWPPIESARGTFLDHSYLGWQEVLPNGGPPTVWGATELGTHGEVSMLEWSATIVADEPDRASVRFGVDLFRMPLRLERTMTVTGDAPAVVWDEVVVNRGEERVPFMWGHHPDFGPPLVDVGAVIDLAPGTVHTPVVDTPRRRLAPAVTAEWPTVPGIEPGRWHDLREVLPKEARVDDSVWIELHDEGWAAVRNRQLGLGAAMLWDAAVFPYVWCWMSYGGSFGYPHYGRIMNLAIEPFTSPVAPLHELVTERPDALRWLDPGEELSTALTFMFLGDVDEPFRGSSDPRVIAVPGAPA